VVVKINRKEKMQKILTGIFTLLCFGFTTQVALAQTVAQPVISFEQVEQLPKDTTVKIPVLINTQGKSLDSLQLKIDVEGQVESLDLQVGTTIPVQEIAKEIGDNNIFVSLTSIDLGKSWSTNEDTELLSITFSYAGDGMVTLSFDEKETLAATSDSENNVLTVGSDLTVKIGEVMPVAEDEIAPSVEQEKMMPVEEPATTGQLNNNLLIGLIAASFVAAAITLVYLLRGGSKAKVEQEPKTPLN
jgi:hypothetical protein